MTEITKSAVDSLVAKFESLGLSEDEQAVIAGLVAAAESADGVVAFALAPREPKGFALPDLRGRLNRIFFDNPKVVVNHEEMY